MKITETCIDCLLSRVMLECTLAHASPRLTEATMTGCRMVMNEIRSAQLSHPQIASRIHRQAYELLKNPDPFAELKRKGNQQASDVCREVRDDLRTFRDYVLASVIGNTFDYGVKGHLVEENFSVFFRREFSKGLFIDHTDKIAPLCSRVVYLCDNCGEIVLDRLLIEYLKTRGSQITLAVKEAPILNDATLQDARDLGLDTIADRVTTTGGGAEIGICMENIPDDLRHAISHCTIIIAKGMANYESLSEMKNLPPVAYLLAAKCRPVADELGVPVGSKIAMLQS
ncbi:MAG TPA: ARMT1-like domain-containing protein [Methanoregula sp.]|nr:ARMT1-like domain-containing protein [Methanoregula sp.]